MNDKHLPCFLDFEASSLRDTSYPIEVAWSLPDGSIEASLISPAWNWSDWDPRAEAVHGIAHETLLRDGASASAVAEKMNRKLTDHICYTDAPEFDRFWLERLFEHSNDDPHFEIRHAESDLMMSLYPMDRFTRRQALERVNFLKRAAWEACGLRQHRAANDVKYLLELYKLVRRDLGTAL